MRCRCPTEACVADSKRKETEAELIARAVALHPDKAELKAKAASGKFPSTFAAKIAPRHQSRTARDGGRKMPPRRYAATVQRLISFASCESTSAIPTMSLEAALVDTTHLDVC